MMLFSQIAFPNCSTLNNDTTTTNDIHSSVIGRSRDHRVSKRVVSDDRKREPNEGRNF